MLIIDPEREAKRILDRFEVIHPPVNVESIARGLGLWVVYKEMELRTSGMLVRRGRQATIGVNQAHHIHRQRFTIAHELGHHLMHHSLVELHVDRALVAFRDDASTLGEDPVEVEANAHVLPIGLDGVYGGIGGGFRTVRMLVPLALSCTGAACRAAGDHTLELRWNGTDGAGSGYRIRPS